MRQEYLKENLNGIPIYRTQIKYNITKLDREVGDIDYICIHDTANTSKDANGYMHYLYFNGGDRNASADFFVDHESITKVNDYYKGYTWAVGDNNHNYRHPYCRNKNSVSVEICVNNIKDEDKMKKTIDNTVILVRELQKWLKIDRNHVLRHFDCSKKLCPGTVKFVIPGPEVAPKWVEFKKRLRD